ncbi:MAG: phosphoglycolate phosphatase, partial [Candidatus Krumholzibacteriia bacterium]
MLLSGNGGSTQQRVPASYDALIFDLDGTLVDTGLDIAISANFVRVQYGLAEVPIGVAKSYVGDGVLKLIERILGHDSATGLTGAKGRSVSRGEVEAGLTVFMEHYRDHVLDNSVLYPGVERVLERCCSMPLFLATNKPRGFTDQLLNGLGLGGMFEHIVAGDETPARKP